MTKVLGFLLLILATPSLGMVAVAALMTPTVTSCSVDDLRVMPIPDSLVTGTRDGHGITLDRQQLAHAATIITVGGQTAGVGDAGVLIALMAGLAESTLRMLSNSQVYPESTDYPHDGDGSDHDSLGIFQMRPASGWGNVADLMDPTYQARAFYGGPTGPNNGSPRGLLDIAGWQSLDPGAAAQAVEVSAYPDRYQNYQPVAEEILRALTRAPSPGQADPAVPETTRVVFPLPAGSYTDTSSYGWRTDPFTGRSAFHAGSDLAAADGTPILAIADGVVTLAGPSSGYGNLIIVEHTVGDQLVASFYAHMWAAGIHVTAGSTVAAGQHIADVGSSGRSSGAHLHLEIHPRGATQPPVDAIDWLKTHAVNSLDDTAVVAASCVAAG